MNAPNITWMNNSCSSVCVVAFTFTSLYKIQHVTYRLVLLFFAFITSTMKFCQSDRLDASNKPMCFRANMCTCVGGNFKRSFPPVKEERQTSPRLSSKNKLPVCSSFSIVVLWLLSKKQRVIYFFYFRVTSTFFCQKKPSICCSYIYSDKHLLWQAIIIWWTMEGFMCFKGLVLPCCIELQHIIRHSDKSSNCLWRYRSWGRIISQLSLAAI